MVVSIQITLELGSLGSNRSPACRKCDILCKFQILVGKSTFSIVYIVCNRLNIFCGCDLIRVSLCTGTLQCEISSLCGISITESYCCRSVRKRLFTLLCKSFCVICFCKIFCLLGLLQILAFQICCFLLL